MNWWIVLGVLCFGVVGFIYAALVASSRANDAYEQVDISEENEAESEDEVEE